MAKAEDLDGTGLAGTLRNGKKNPRPSPGYDFGFGGSVLTCCPACCDDW